jgi:starch synthase (maltosyl-transferring)
LFPTLAGRIDQWETHLDRIAEMEFDWIFLNPFHLTGASGSLYAVADYYSLHPALQSSRKLSAAKSIERFVAAAAKRGLSVMMDLVINHTAKDGLLPSEHPDWFLREPDGTLRSPFCVDPADTRKKTVWEDLAEIDYRDRPERGEVIAFFDELIRHYLGLGIRGFRCDAAYQVPSAVWKPLIEAGRGVHPDVVFVAENLGAPLAQAEALSAAGFDYLFNSSKWWDFEADWLLEQYEKFRRIAPTISFPETHDTERLATDLAARGITDRAAVERCYQRAYLFAAVFATGVMIPMGFEYGFRRKLHVVKTTPADWEEPWFDLTRYIAEVNRMRASLAVLNTEGPQRAIRLGSGQATCLVRTADRGGDWVATLVNPDLRSAVSARIEGLGHAIAGGRQVAPAKKSASLVAGSEVRLGPGEVKVFASRS